VVGLRPIRSISGKRCTRFATNRDAASRSVCIGVINNSFLRGLDGDVSGNDLEMSMSMKQQVSVRVYMGGGGVTVHRTSPALDLMVLQSNGFARREIVVVSI